MARKDTYHHGSLRQELIAKGLGLIAREGLAGFSLRALATELGVSHAAPYRHFASKEELLVAIVEESRSRFSAALLASVSGSEEARDKIYLLGEAYVRFYLDNPEILALFNILPNQLAGAEEGLRSALSPSPSLAEEGQESELMRDEGFLVLRRTAAVLAADFPGLSERDILLGYWAKVHGLATILCARRDYFAPENLDEGLRRVVRRAF